jgi:hypothetical protein
MELQEKVQWHFEYKVEQTVAYSSGLDSLQYPWVIGKPELPHPAHMDYMCKKKCYGIGVVVERSGTAYSVGLDLLLYLWVIGKPEHPSIQSTKTRIAMKNVMRLV